MIRVTFKVIVKQNRKVLIGEAIFKNVSVQPVLVMEGAGGYGLRGDIPSEPADLWMDEYDIRDEADQRVAYRGSHAHFGPIDRDFFAAMNPGETLDLRRDRLDKAYSFSQGHHTYTISHLHREYDEQAHTSHLVKSRCSRFAYDRD